MNPFHYTHTNEENELHMSITNNWDIDEMDHIYFRTLHEGWKLWTYIAESSLICQPEHRQDQIDFGYGLFAGRNFKTGEYIGKFTGRLINIEEIDHMYDTKWIVQTQTDSIDTRHGNTGFVQFVNDAFNTTSYNNAYINENGFLVALTNIPFRCEILMSYGTRYWE